MRLLVDVDEVEYLMTPVQQLVLHRRHYGVNGPIKY